MTENQTITEAIILEDKGSIPNSPFPLLIYRNAFSERGNKGAEWLENIFSSNQWTNSWRWRIYDFHHYHSNTHEVLGVFEGSAMLLMGGEGGKIFTVNPGDIIIIPAGVGHKCLEYTSDFEVVGAYPNGMSPDMKKGEKGERPFADLNISKVPLPPADPVYGQGGLIHYWK
jgi:uncharacterized protein YjlB